MLKRIISSSSDKGYLIFDPFNGSGTTGIVAHMLGRKYIGIDTDKNFLDITIKRFQNAKKQTELNSYYSLNSFVC